LLIDRGFAVGAVGGNGVWHAPGSFLHPLHRRRQLRRIWIALLHGVVEHDTVNVVDDLGFVPELDRPAQAALAIRRASPSC
jgi:hypothetical protein